MNTSKTVRPRWSVEDEKLIRDNINALPEEIQIVLFPNRSISAVRAKQQKLQQEEEYARRGAWAAEEIEYLRKNIDRHTQYLQITIPRPSQEISIMKWYLRNQHIPKRRVLSTEKVIRAMVTTSVHGVTKKIEDFYQKAEAMKTDSLRKIALDELKIAEMHLRKFEKLLEADQI